MGENVLSVSELNGRIKALFDSDASLLRVYVRGELSNYKVYPSGHHYFTMKDAESSLKCVMFKGAASKLRYRPENGMNVVAFGRVDVYHRDGLYQLYVSDLTPDGVGDLYIAFEQLKEKLQREGLFDERHKKRLPRFPGSVAVITSPAGAAVRDIIRILRSRWPMTKVIVMPVRVQGVEAPQEIAEAISLANELGEADLIITGRGGGSLEDLQAFNDERVARAIFGSRIPVISAVGHEPDVTISDFVADVRAATPSNAAEIAVPDAGEAFESLRSSGARMRQSIGSCINTRRQRIDGLLGKRALQSPRFYIDDKRMLLDHSQDKLCAAMQTTTHSDRERFASLAAALDAMSPMKVLGRGYAIARKADGEVIKGASDVAPGDRITVRLREDQIGCVVEG